MTEKEGLCFERAIALVTRITVFFNYLHTVIAILKGYPMYKEIRILFNFVTGNQIKSFPQYFSYSYLNQRNIPQI